MRININKRTLRKVTAKHMSINVPAQKIEDNIEPVTENPKSEITEAETVIEEIPVIETAEMPVSGEEEEVKVESKKNGKKSKKSTTDSKEENNKE